MIKSHFAFTLMCNIKKTRSLYPIKNFLQASQTICCHATSKRHFLDVLYNRNVQYLNYCIRVPVRVKVIFRVTHVSRKRHQNAVKRKQTFKYRNKIAVFLKRLNISPYVFRPFFISIRDIQLSNQNVFNLFGIVCRVRRPPRRHMSLYAIESVRFVSRTRCRISPSHSDLLVLAASYICLFIYLFHFANETLIA